MTQEQKEQIKAPRETRKISLSDWLVEQDLALCRAQPEKVNGNGSHTSRFCDCPELLLHGKRSACPPQHDCEYSHQRSALVKEAAARATKRVPLVPFKHGEAWTKCFVSEMEKLSAPLLRQSGNGAHEQKAAQNCE